MRQSAAVLCNDKASLETLKPVLEQLHIEMVKCRTRQEALELVMTGVCSTLFVDFDIPGSDEAIRMANLLSGEQKPRLIAIASRVWPGTGQAFQSGAGRILYRPLEAELVKEALKSGRKSARQNRRRVPRYDMKTLVHLELESGTLAAISIDIGEHGLAVQAADPLPMSSNIPFRCVLPGTQTTLHGHADVIWASDQGRAGLFFSKLTPAARKQLTNWLHKRAHYSKQKSAVRDLLPPTDAHVSFAMSSEEVQTEA
jgi:ActR/RegA family two-component response regulator